MLGGALGDQVSPSFASRRAQIDDPVAAGDHIDVVLDDDDRVARVTERAHGDHEHLDVREVEPRGGLVQHVEGPTCGPLGQLPGQLDPLGLAAGQGRGGLAELDVAQADPGQRLEPIPQLADGLELLACLIDGEVEGIGDAHAPIEHLQGLPIVALAPALLAGDEHVR